MRTVLAASLAAALVITAGCANIPEASSPVAVPNAGGPQGATAAEPDRNTDPIALVRDFIGEAGDPGAARVYLTDEAKQKWQGGGPPTIIDETFGAAPLPPQEKKTEGDAQQQLTETTVVLTVTPVGRLGLDRAFIPMRPTQLEYKIVVRRAGVGEPWRIQVPPDIVLITLPKFNTSYQQVSLYFFDSEFRVAVPDLRYIASKPPEGIPDRVMRLLLSGPSDTMKNAVRSALEPNTEMATNAVADSDGALVVNLTKFGDKSADERKLIVAQIVLSLRHVTLNRMKLMVDGHPMVANHTDWRPGDLPSYDSLTKPNANLPGLFTNPAGQVHALDTGQPIPGPAGTGELKVQSAAQSLDGSLLAAVTEIPTGVQLRIGQYGKAMGEVDLQAFTLTRPTWLLGTSTDGSGSNELWTVKNSLEVVRVVRTPNNTWATSQVNASQLNAFGTITDLRLSRDGVRVALVANGKVVVASVVRLRDSVTISSPRILREEDVKNVVSVDWRTQDVIVVAIGGRPSLPVASIPVDGFQVDHFNPADVTNNSLTAIAAAPDRDVVVTDSRGMWSTSEQLGLWSFPLVHQIPNARAFYPG
jgi:hypothetical protein